MQAQTDQASYEIAIQQYDKAITLRTTYFCPSLQLSGHCLW